MAEKKKAQLTLQEYMKIKNTMIRNKLKLNFPWYLKACMVLPLLYIVFLIAYYIFHVRFVAEH